MRSGLLRKAIFLSALGHFSAFVLFSFSFGSNLSPLNAPQILFWGSFLKQADLKINHSYVETPAAIEKIQIYLPRSSAFKISSAEMSVFTKPQLRCFYNDKKMSFAQRAVYNNTDDKKSRVIIFKPGLPEDLMIYFKDRQQAYLELAYTSGNPDNPGLLLIKRKISSGNLEVDLLCMRYLSHYLSLRRDLFTSNKWNKASIELAPK
ncbi:MAG: hypothetical protein C4533_06995 [Candidatus Omnitrophota bacterium]|jgi:hypothetical protein|nr:MAG: hypothetical protein C4533_06995 [Candidatus Omnitrophota bacterium]